MKTIKTIIASIFLVSSLLAIDANVTKDMNDSKLSIDMREMLLSMQHIQKSGFYQDYDGMIEGAQSLVGGLKSLQETDAKGYLPYDEAYANKFSKKRTDMILLYANDLIESASTKDMDEALENYTQLMKQCTTCHIRIRTW